MSMTLFTFRSITTMKRSLITNNQQIMCIFQRRLSRKTLLKVITPSHFDRHLHSSWLSKKLNQAMLYGLCFSRNNYAKYRPFSI